MVWVLRLGAWGLGFGVWGLGVAEEVDEVVGGEDEVAEVGIASSEHNPCVIQVMLIQSSAGIEYGWWRG